MLNPEIWYFESSAVGFLRRRHSAFDARATRDLQREKNRWLSLSSVTLFEVLSTPADDDREALLFFIQNFFEREMLLSPEEAVVRFIKARCPLYEPPSDLRSRATLGRLWREMVDDPQRTVRFDEGARRHVEVIRKFARLLYNAVRNERIERISGIVTDFQITAEFLVQRIKHPVIALCEQRDQIRTHRITALLVMLMMCAEMSPSSEVYRTFWSEVNASDVLERFDYLASTTPEIFFRGPFVLMAMMAQVQANRPFSRGMLFDCMHATYLPYCDMFFSDDTHFVDFRGVEDHILLKKIHRISDMQVTHTMRDVDMPKPRHL